MSGAVASGTWEGAFYGAFTGLAFHNIGQTLGASTWAQGDFLGDYSAAGLAAKTVSHGITGGAITHMQGGRFGHGFLSSGVTAASSPYIATKFAGNRYAQGATAAIVGGTVSSATGGKFANGAVTAAMAYAFNELGDRPRGSADVERPTLKVDPDFVGPLTENDFRNIDMIQEALNVVAESVSVSNDLEAIEILNSGIEVIYYPSGIPGYSDYAAFADTFENRISFGPPITPYTNPKNTFIRQNYWRLQLRGGGLETTSRITAHEYGHFSRAAMRAGYSPRNERPASEFANRLIPYFP